MLINNNKICATIKPTPKEKKPIPQMSQREAIDGMAHLLSDEEVVAFGKIMDEIEQAKVAL